MSTAKTRLTALAVAATAGAMLGMATTPASASSSYDGGAYIDASGYVIEGFDPYFDDWRDEGKLTTSINAVSNATCLWQKILWADNLLGWNEIDGIFGSRTASATATWKSRHGLPSDGIVGDGAFDKASDFMQDRNGDPAVDTYLGAVHTFNLWRTSDGRYHFYDKTGANRAAGYNYRTCA
ncbi:peptidoglycan-binding protein [Streptomyces polyrhachis]|uniref:Peptidoglycan-binding protein n=1 Tax=Streptomyces polyrhachis TaxID=1282885 RepID=A0ABW2GJ10_9ACTN